MKKLAFIILSGLILLNPDFSNIYAQNIYWNYTPRRGFVFEISNDEAQKLLPKNTSNTLSTDLLHTLIDTFDVKTGWVNRPAKGHFILARIVENMLHCEYTSVFPYQVFLFKEYDALSLQVLDFDGNVREDANVRLGHRRLRLDKESKTYRLENKWITAENRIATVELDGFRSVFNIQKHNVPTWYRNDYNQADPTFYSYMITDKNKYKPNEQVRFKSYSLSQYKSPLRRELDVWLILPRNHIKIGQVSPHRPGSFAGEIHLHDSLNLTLDKHYTLQLRDKNRRVVSQCNFKYEDYELFGNKLEIELSDTRHYFPEINQLTITATDVNGLLLKDAKASILVKPNTIRESFQPFVILPDTLLFLKIDLIPDAPTVIDLPSDLFEKTNTFYEVQVSVIDSKNERLEKSISANHFYSMYELIARLSNDSICFELLYNDELMEDILTILQISDDIVKHKISLPYREKLNPAITSYRIENEYISKQFLLSQLRPDIEITGGIEKDSFILQLHNPHEIEVSWYIYQGSQLLKKGFGREMEFNHRIETREQTFYSELIYSFGGQDHINRNQYVFREDYLKIILNLPERIYPGQEVDATIQVSNQLGNPLRGVDLTALAVTSKLNYYLPDLPYYGSSSRPRPRTAHYSKESLNKRETKINLDYNKWSKLARLDTMKYYQFTYPGSKPFIHKTNCNDSTQFAPYVMHNGRAMLIYVIEVNRKPVYYSWTDQPDQYSFYVVPDTPVEISLRLHDRVIILDSITFEKDKKTIFSISLNNLPNGTRMGKLNNELSPIEKNRHLLYISTFKNVYGRFAYLESEDGFTPLFTKLNTKKEILSGPVSQGIATYVESESLRTTYKHSGGYSYTFEDNIVYKMNASKLLPDVLYDRNYNPMQNINDLVFNKDKFLDSQKVKYSRFNWQPKIINIVDQNLNVKVLLPIEINLSGVAALLFEDCVTKNTVSSHKVDQYRDINHFQNIPTGCFNVIVLYNNGDYLKMGNLHLQAHAQAIIDLRYSMINQVDSLSEIWLQNHNWEHITYSDKQPETHSPHTSSYRFQGVTGNIEGTIYDQSNSPLPGANILVKGTTYGTVSNIDGHFSLQIDNRATLIISFIGYLTEEIEVESGSKVVIRLIDDVQSLDEVVVVGYGTTRRSDLTGSVSSVSGAGTTPPDDEVEEKRKEDEIIQEAEQRLYQELLTLNSIRSNFSDVGFWEPRLYTDRHGNSQFKVTFPDDITRWDALVYAMNRNLQTGTVRKSIRSYKPLMAELHVPQFLTRGDSAFFTGRVLNYTSDTIILGKVEWSGANTDFEKRIHFSQFHTDKLPVIASTTDSITTRYLFTRDDNYLDGEERTISVVEQGTPRADGILSFMNNGDSLNVKSSANETITIEILDNQISIYTQEVRYLLNYRYACNEQLASKLIGLINHKMIQEFEGKPFRYDRDVNKIIQRLLKNQNREFLWSWWDISENTSYWMSSHILRALKFAQDAGYQVDLNVNNLTGKATYKYDLLKNFSFNDIDLLHALASWNAKLDYDSYINILDSIIIVREKAEEENAKKYLYSRRNSYLKEKLLLLEISQLAGLPVKTDALLRYKKDGILGDVYFSDGLATRQWHNNDLATNVIAYRIVKNDSLLQHLKVPVQIYLLSSRTNGGWNTYQSSGILMSVLPDLLAEGYSRGFSAEVSIRGKENKAITEFPYKIELQPNEEIFINKISGLPLYYTQYVMERVTEAKTGVEGFQIKTYFNTGSNLLEAGQPVDLIVEVEVTKDAASEHVMIEVPIPGACSYEDKRQVRFGVETHREYFKEQTAIFCEKMKPGTYIFKINLLPRFTGKYILNPAQVSLMYLPVVNANTEMRSVVVED